MPSLDWNNEAWTNAANWTTEGDEWSDRWGGPEAQWHFSLLPRIRKHLPAPTILEIAPGFGRWTQFLLGHCEQLIGVDLTEKCVQACRQRFADEPRAEFFVNDGFSLGMVDDETVDFVVSFDSLVHAEWDVIEAYLAELVRVLKPTGSAVLHHSNLAALPGQVNWHGRAETVSGGMVIAECNRIGLSVISQERLNWVEPELSDCITVLTRGDAPEPMIVDNPGFTNEAGHIAAVARLY